MKGLGIRQVIWKIEVKFMYEIQNHFYIKTVEYWNFFPKTKTMEIRTLQQRASQNSSPSSSTPYNLTGTISRQSMTYIDCNIDQKCSPCDALLALDMAHYDEIVKIEESLSSTIDEMKASTMTSCNSERIKMKLIVCCLCILTLFLLGKCLFLNGTDVVRLSRMLGFFSFFIASIFPIIWTFIQCILMLDHIESSKLTIPAESINRRSYHMVSEILQNKNNNNKYSRGTSRRTRRQQRWRKRWKPFLETIDE